MSSQIANAILSTITDFAYLFDREGRFQFANKPLLDLWGLTLENIVGKNFFELGYPADLAAKLQGQIQQVFETRSRLVDETEYVSPAGSVGYYEYIFSPVLGADGAIEAVAGSTRIITDRQQAEAERKRLIDELRAERARLAEVFYRSPSFMTVLQGPQHVFELANDRYYELFGRRELIGRTVREAFPEVEGQGFFELLDRVYETGETFVGKEMRILLQLDPGAPLEERFIEFVYQPTRGPDGSINGIFAHGLDLTHRKRADDRVARDAMLLANVQDSVIVTDLGGIITFWNEGATRLFGWTADEMMGRPYAERLPEPARTEVIAWIEHIAKGEAEFSGEWLDFRKDGSTVWIEATTRCVTDTNGKPLHIMGVARDISARKRTDAALQESEERHRAMLAALEEGISLHDAAGTIIMANASAERILGLTLAQLCGRDSFDPRWRAVSEDGSYLPGDQHPPQVAVRTGHTVINYVMGVHRPDGAIVWVSVNSVPLRNTATGRITGAVTSFFDITARKRAEEEREQLLAAERYAWAESERAGRMKDDFLATLSHELRTPLNAILGWSQILAGGPRNEKDLTEGLKTIERNARAQTQIIEDLLDMSRIISGKVRLNVQQVDLASIVYAAIDTIKPAADAKSIRIQSILDPHAGPISGDPNRLQQIFWNLLSNSIKFTPKGGRVQVVLERVNSHLEISVTDTGQGIRPDFLPYVFDRFSQSDASTTRVHGGLGLGLAIVKQLVELHGGTIAAKSAGPGLGATFTIRLPQVIMRVEPEPPMEPAHRRGSGLPATADSCAEIAGVRVLVVDDEADARALIKRFLEDCKAVVSIASTAAEGLELLSKELPDVLISDIGMPGMDGYEFLRRVRATAAENGGNTSAIALTAYARSEDRIRAIVAGFQHHLAKPVAHGTDNHGCEPRSAEWPIRDKKTRARWQSALGSTCNVS